MSDSNETITIEDAIVWTSSAIEAAVPADVAAEIAAWREPRR